MSDITSDMFFHGRSLYPAELADPAFVEDASFDISAYQLRSISTSSPCIQMPPAKSNMRVLADGCCFPGETPAFSAKGLLLNLAREENPDYDAGHKGRRTQVN